MSLYLAGPTQQQMHDLHLVHKALFNHSKPVTRTAQALATGLERPRGLPATQERMDAQRQTLRRCESTLLPEATAMAGHLDDLAAQVRELSDMYRAVLTVESEANEKHDERLALRQAAEEKELVLLSQQTKEAMAKLDGECDAMVAQAKQQLDSL